MPHCSGFQAPSRLTALVSSSSAPCSISSLPIRASRGSRLRPLARCRRPLASVAARLAIALIALGVLALTFPASARAYHDWAPIDWHYSLSPGCQNNVDPITLIIFGDQVSTVNQEEMIWWHTGWGSGDAAGGQFIDTSYSGCVETDADRAECHGHCDRRHVRLRYAGPAKYFAYAAQQSISPWTGVVVATPHREIWDDNCQDGTLGFGTGAHRTVDFSATRDLVKWSMSSNHNWEVAYYGNSEPRPQCQEREVTYAANADGLVYYIHSFPLYPEDPCGGVC